MAQPKLEEFSSTLSSRGNVENTEREARRADRHELFREYNRNDAFGKNDSLFANTLRAASLTLSVICLALLAFSFENIAHYNQPMLIVLLTVVVSTIAMLRTSEYRRSFKRFVRWKSTQSNFERWARKLRSLLAKEKESFNNEYVARYFYIMEAALKAKGSDERHIGLLRQLSDQREGFYHTSDRQLRIKQLHEHVQKSLETLESIEGERSREVNVPYSEETIHSMESIKKALRFSERQVSRLFKARTNLYPLK